MRGRKDVGGRRIGVESKSVREKKKEKGRVKYIVEMGGFKLF